MKFKNRAQAGKLLADELSRYQNQDTVVYALPRGGVPLGYEIAKALACPLDLIIARKVGHPINSEYAVCAVTEKGPLICNEREKANIDPDWLAAAESSERQEAKRRKSVYMAGRQSVEASGKTAIIVDDGVATGLTMLAAIEAVKKKQPKTTVIAVPVLPRDTAEELQQHADKLMALDIPAVYLGAVGAYYSEFPQLTDQEVISIMRKLN